MWSRVSTRERKWTGQFHFVTRERKLREHNDLRAFRCGNRSESEMFLDVRAHVAPHRACLSNRNGTEQRHECPDAIGEVM
jgi:hypothetical protein